MTIPDRGRLTWRPAALAWIAAFAPRLAVILWLVPSGDYFVYVGHAPSSFWYPGYDLLSRGLWWMAAGSVGVLEVYHAAIAALLGPAMLLLCRHLGLDWRANWIAVLTA